MLGLGQEALAISQSRNPGLWLRLGKPRQAIAEARAQLEEATRPNKFLALKEPGMALAAAGDFEEAGPLLEDALQRNGRRISLGSLFGAHEAVALVTIRRHLADKQGASELLEAMKGDVSRSENRQT